MFLIHPAIVHFPLALWLTSSLFDLLAWWRTDAMFRRSAYWLVGLGLLGALVSIAAGWIDLFGLERQGIGTALRQRHAVHSWLAYAATFAYAGNFFWRYRTQNETAPRFLVLSMVGAALIGATGYMGGELRNVM